MTDKDATQQLQTEDAQAAGDAPFARAKPLPRGLPIVRTDTGLIPARMINEVLYCERLMYLEWVQGEWDDNAFTVDGQGVHRRVNEEGKPLREPRDDDGNAEPEPYAARSVWLSSERLGITAKIDLVEVEDAAVVPIEYKRGAKPDVPEGAYLPELAQVCAQVLLLREHGYICEYGEIYYAKDRRRVSITIDDALIARTLGAVERIRELAREGVLPAPLVDSPKCNGCSLVGICLPDETRALADTPTPTPALEDDTSFEVGEDPWNLAGGAMRPVRRLFPARDDKLPVYVQAQGAVLRLDGERLIIQSKDEELRLPPNR